jgi:hypothetical protein
MTYYKNFYKCYNVLAAKLKKQKQKQKKGPWRNYMKCRLNLYNHKKAKQINQTVNCTNEPIRSNKVILSLKELLAVRKCLDVCKKKKKKSNFH